MSYKWDCVEQRNEIHEVERQEYRDALAQESEMERAHDDSEMR